MSRLRNALQSRLGGVLINALITFSLSLPMLLMLSLPGLAMMAAFWALAISLVFDLITRVKGRLGSLLSLALLLLLASLMLLSPGSLPGRGLSFLRAVFSGASPQAAASLYSDALLPLISLVLGLYARLIMEGEPSFSLPLLLAPLVPMWFAGARGDLLVYLPAACCLPLVHLYHSQQENEKALAQPGGWGRGLRAIALLLALVLLAFALSPSQPQTMPEAEQLAKNIRQRLEDLFFFTKSRNSFSLSSQGYQPMGESGLGGQPNISKNPVFRVTAPGRTYLRGTALDTYSGRAWFDTLSRERYSLQSLRFAGLKAQIFDEALPQNERNAPETVEVWLLHEMPSTLFLGQRLRSLAPGEGMVGYFNASSEVFTTHDLAVGEHYAFRHEAYVADQGNTNALAQRLKGAADPAFDRLDARYTALPKHLLPDGAVAKLAQDITSGITEPYDQALALMRYLKTNYAYTLEVPDAPTNLDFASHFLFDVKGGYCTYFATAMTVLARSLGLPARYVEGFLAKPQGSETMTITGENAHAWTEIYIAGLGWVTFDATPGSGESADGTGDRPKPPENSPDPSPTPSEAPTPSPRPEEQEEPSPEPSPKPQDSQPPEGQQDLPTHQPQDAPVSPDTKNVGGFPWLILLLLLLLLALAILYARRRSFARQVMRAAPGQRLIMYWQGLLFCLACQKKPMLPTETAMDYAKRAAPEDQDLQLLAKAHSALTYGKKVPTEAEVRLAQATYQKTYDALRMHQKALLGARRLFVSLKNDLRALPGKITKSLRAWLSRRKRR